MAFRLAFGLCCLALALASPAASTRKNVLFIAGDDFRVQVGKARVPGTPTMHTPNLDDLFNKSLFLRKAQVQQGVCGPTRASMLTSRYPDTTRVWDLYSYWRDVGGNFTTIPQWFKEQGYRSVGAGKIFHPGHASGGSDRTSGDDVPYSWTDPYFHAPNLGYWSGKTKVPGCDGCGNSWIAVKPDVEKDKPLPDSQIADKAVEALAQFAKDSTGSPDKPFFLAVGFHKPHLPFVFPERFLDKYPLDEIALPEDQDPQKDIPAIAWNDWGELIGYVDIAALKPKPTGAPGDHLPEDVTKALRRAYFAAVSFTDYNVGLVLAALKEHGFENNTVISFWGDHGWQLGEHGEWAKHTNWDIVTNSPMSVHVPGVTDSGIESTAPTEALDLFPTLAEAAAGVKIPACPSGNTSHIRLCTQGVSLLPLVTDPHSPVKKAAYSQYPRGYQKPKDVLDVVPKVGGDDGQSACLYKACTMGYTMLVHHLNSEFRYTEWVDFNTKNFGAPDWGRVVGLELYNHTADALENTNVAPGAPKDLLDYLSGLLHKGYQ